MSLVVFIVRRVLWTIPLVLLVMLATFALARAGREDAKLYPGSWSDWCSRGLPVDRG